MKNNDRQESKVEFDVNNVGVPNGRYFGMPFDNKECPVVLISVPWDTTVSYSEGAAQGPDAIINASIQVDLYDEKIQDSDKLKIGTDETKIDLGDGEKLLADDYIKLMNIASREKAKKIIDKLSDGKKLTASLIKMQKEVNESSEGLNYLVEQICNSYYKLKKIPGVVGGEHSVAFGAIKAAAANLKRGEKLGILQFDAHADLRESYEGFEYSHASVMYNVVNKINNICSLTQVGIRDFCVEEHNIIKKYSNKKSLSEKFQISSFTDSLISEREFKGENWDTICKDIIKSLPKNVYISFDIDGLEPSLCPNTGTPVPGGLSFAKALYLLRKVAENRNIVGFDLNEVAPAKDGADEWDANVGARLLHKMALLSVVSQK